MKTFFIIIVLSFLVSSCYQAPVAKGKILGSSETIIIQDKDLDHVTEGDTIRVASYPDYNSGIWFLTSHSDTFQVGTRVGIVRLAVITKKQ